MINFNYLEYNQLRDWTQGRKDIPFTTTVFWLEGVEEDPFNYDRYAPDKDFEYIKTDFKNIRKPLIKTAEAYSVRMKIYGLTKNLKFTAPLISFIWRGYYRDDNSGPQIRNSLKFCLAFTIGTVTVHTEWLTIKSITPLWDTSLEEAGVTVADAEIEAIPWIYAYNIEVPWCPRGQYNTGYYYPVLSQEQFNKQFFKSWDFFDYTKFFTPIGNPMEYWDTIAALLMQSKYIHDFDLSSRSLKDPCPVSGPYIKLYDSADLLHLHEFKYLEKFKETLSSIEQNAPFGLQLNGLIHLAKSVQATILSILSWKAVSLGYMLGFDLYNSTGLSVSDEFYEVPVITFKRIPKYPIGDWEFQNLHSIYTFLSIERENCKIEKISATYEVSKYTVTYTGVANAFDAFVSLPTIDKFQVNISSWSWNVYSIDTAELTIYNAYYSSGVAYIKLPASDTVRKDTEVKILASGYGIGLGAVLNSSGGSIYGPANMGNNLSNNTHFGVMAGVLSVTSATDYFGEGTSVKVDLYGAEQVQYRGPNRYFKFQYLPEYSIINQLVEITEKLTFTAEWRPWINIYDIIYVTYIGEFGKTVRDWFYVVAIDADSDSARAIYTAYKLVP